MNDEKLRIELGANIAAYRKRAGLTQAGLAEKLNYSDKAVSKWERGESLPDVLTLVQLAELFDVTVNDLLVDPNELPADGGKVQKVMEIVSEKALKRKPDKKIVQLLCSTLVWFVALFAFVILSSLDIEKSWLAFFYAIPIDAVVILTLRSAWRDFRWNKVLISQIMWGYILALYISLLVFLGLNLWKLFLLGIPGQAAIILWFRLFYKVRKEDSHG